MSEIEIPIQVAQNCLVASIQIDVSPATLEHFQKKLLNRLQKEEVRAVILDFSGLAVMDVDDFDVIRDITKACRMMGYPCVLSNLNPGIISALVDMNADTRGILSALDLEQAFECLDEQAR